MSALGRAGILLAAQAAWLASAGGLASDLGPGPARFLAFLGGALCLALAGVLRLPRRRELTAGAMGVVGGIALVPGLAAGIAAGVAAAPTGAFDTLPVAPLRGRALPAVDVFQLAAVGALAPVCEEVLFRRLAFDALCEWRSVGSALWLSSFGFGVWHGLGGEALVAGAIGLLLGGLRIASSGIAASIGTHAGLNLGLLLGGARSAANPLAVGVAVALAIAALCAAVAIARHGAQRG